MNRALVDAAREAQQLNEPIQPMRYRLFWPCNPNTLNPPDHAACTGEFDFLDGHEVCTCECHNRDTSVSILAVLASPTAETGANLLKRSIEHLAANLPLDDVFGALGNAAAIGTMQDLRDSLICA